MKVVEHGLDQDTSLTRKTKRKKRSPQKRENVVEKHLDPAVRVKVSDSVLSKSKLGTEPSNGRANTEDSAVVNIGANGSGDIRRPAPSDKLAALNQNSGDIPGVNVSPVRSE